MAGLRREHPDALNTEKVLGVLCEMMEDKITTKRASIERTLGADLGPLEAEVERRLEASFGKSLGGKDKASAATMKEVMKVVAAAVKNAVPPAPPVPAPEEEEGKENCDGDDDDAAAARAINAAGGESREGRSR